MGPICRLEQRNHFHFHHQETKLRSPPCTCGGRWCLYSCCPSIFCCVAHSLVSKHLLCFSFFFLEALSGFSYFPSLASHFVSGGFLVVYRSTLANINYSQCVCRRVWRRVCSQTFRNKCNFRGFRQYMTPITFSLTPPPTKIIIYQPPTPSPQVHSLSVHQKWKKLEQLWTLPTDGSAVSVNILFPAFKDCI